MNKGQIYYVEFIFAVFVFFAVLVFFISNVLTTLDESGLTQIAAEAKFVSEDLMSEGRPENWNVSNVQKIGITDGASRIDTTKLSMFANMSNSSYTNAKSLFNIASDYYVYLETKNGTRILIDGQPGVGKNYSDSKKIIKNVRLAVYNNTEIVRLVVLVWQKV